MQLASRLLKSVICSLLMVLLLTDFAVSAELDDSVLFVEAFNAYQKKDYLLAIERLGLLNQIFPETPLRDVTLLLLARAGFRAGDNELAAKSVNKFGSEFAESSLTATIEDELLNIGERHKKGEKLAANKQLRAAAQKVRNEQLAAERVAALKAEQERLAREKAELERVAREKLAAERRERERIAAEKADKESIRLAISVPVEGQQTEVGQKGDVPFEVSNRGTKREEFVISSAAAAEYATVVTAIGNPEEALTRVSLAAGETFKGRLSFRMPANRVDGYRARFQLRAVSARFSDVSFSRDALITASAPLVRAVAKPLKARVAPGETFKYRVSVLNAGSLPVKGLTIRANLPEQVDLLDASGITYRQEATGDIIFLVDQLESGRLAEFNLNVKVRAGVAEKQELRCQVEVAGVLVNEKITSSPAVVLGK